MNQIFIVPREAKALMKAKLEPYLGFLHSIQHGKPSLVCDFQELYRYLIDDFLILSVQKENFHILAWQWFGAYNLTNHLSLFFRFFFFLL